MTADSTTLRIPPEIRRRLEGIEAELWTTPSRAPLPASRSTGRPALYVVDGSGARVRAGSLRRRSGRRSRLAGALSGVAASLALVAVLGLAAMGAHIGPFAVGGPGGSGGADVSGVTGPGSSASASSAVASPSPSSSALLFGSPPPLSSAPGGLSPSLSPPLVDIQLIRVATDPSSAATDLLHSTCFAKVPTPVDQVEFKKLLMIAISKRVTAGWLDDAKTVVIAADSIDAAQAMGAITVVEGPDESWFITRDKAGLLAHELQGVSTIKGYSAWWSPLAIRPITCP